MLQLPDPQPQIRTFDSNWYTAANSITLTVPKLTVTTSNQADPSWHRCLHVGYNAGFTKLQTTSAIGPIVGLGKIRHINRSDPTDVQIDYWWWLIQLPRASSSWVRGHLDEGQLHLDGRISRPQLQSGTPIGQLGQWQLKFLVGLHQPWQYKSVAEIIGQANRCLPPELRIREDWECCLDPGKLISHSI